MAKIKGTDGSDSINGKVWDDTITASQGNDTLTGGGGNDKFVYKDDYYNRKTDIITDFGRVAKGTNSTAAVIAEVDTLIFQSDGLTVQNLLLAQNGNNLEITFEKGSTLKVILQNFALQNLNNPSLSTGGTFGLGNIEFDNQTSITKSFDVFNANSTQSTIFKKNTATFLNELSNNVSGFDNSNDVINGQGGNDKIDGKSGNDILRGGVGNDTLIGGAGNDTLKGYTGIDSLKGGIGDDRLYTDGSLGNNTLNGGAGDDTLNAQFSSGDNLLSGGDGNDFLDISGYEDFDKYGNEIQQVPSLGNNTLNGGAGDDTLNAQFSFGNNLLSGGNGNDFFDLSSILAGSIRDLSLTSLVTETVDGGMGNDVLRVSYHESYTSSSRSPEGITTIFNATDNIGSITSGKNRVSYKNIEGLNIQGTRYDDLIVGSNGNDTIDDRINDRFNAPGYSYGNDTIDGGIGDDVLTVRYDNYTDNTQGITTIFNATTNIGSITASANNQVSYKNIERLNIYDTAFDDLIVGSNGNDTIYVGEFYNESFRESGSNNDTIDGGVGDDLLTVNYVNYYEDEAYASGPNEGITTTFNATTNVGSITGGAKYQVSYKNIERLNISGTQYDDNIVGSNGNDTLSASAGYYWIYGDNDNDTIDGGKGDDMLSGGHGDGNDSLIGGDGTDTFAFGYGFDQKIDTIYDFNATNELIQVSAYHFGGGLSIGSLSATQFTIGTSATASEERFMYNSATGGLFFDKDGSASGFTQVQFALVTAGLSLTEKNFVVV
ncbi:calcium-binding protein [Nostoc sp. CHAB 5836]|uniref:calcium-binding protein n=1 Tax=Nostoc sp. CHAB 5836 TaxID=2780404 RepID=UPI00227215A9|nr:calcium-binding protein [Nostoc sp. CHAB 5836]